MNSNFFAALKFTRDAEGGFTVDDGGPTNFGITQSTYDDYRESLGSEPQSVKLITQGEVQAIMQTEYWQPSHCDQLPLRLSVCQFDAAINSGPTEAVRMLQEALGISADGDFGPITYGAVLGCNDTETAQKYLDVRTAFLRDICQGEDPHIRLDGYMNRIANLRAYLKTLGA